MEIPIKRLKNGFAMPVFGLGTWQMGGRREPDPKNDDAADVEAIRRAVASGLTHIDTAEIYAAGHTEKLVSEALKSLDRSQLFLVSKVSSDHLNYDQILQSCKASLKRLGTDYLDLYLAHAYKPGTNLKAVAQAFDELVEQGLVRHIGVSNFGIEHLKEIQNYANHPIVCDQVHYSLIFREPERTGLLRFCQENDVLLVAWRPVQKGGLTKPGIPLLDDMCRKYGQTPVQVAINWLISQPNVITLSKMRQKEHLAENLGALEWKLSDEDIELLRRDFPGQRDISDTVPLG